ncbi:programmed cell death 5 [Cryptosporidium sp. chipmunk genotype I]|uniref:programmed cell death 5 n=1 Tax=Cryptosporidium sp. chipmunk genotype I TaxID=1280935 RepID=UPI00351A356C|nr:programmed cell death 5 [Cryptosporidium sp. chipmunk genotype I]
MNGSNDFKLEKNGSNNASPIDAKQEFSQRAEDQKKIIEEQRRGALRAILENSAIERLNRIALVKPDKVLQIEDYILRTARNHGYSPFRKMQENELVNMISMMNETTEKSSSKIKIYRRGIFDDDDYEF